MVKTKKTVKKTTKVAEKVEKKDSNEGLLNPWKMTDRLVDKATSMWGW